MTTAPAAAVPMMLRTNRRMTMLSFAPDLRLHAASRAPAGQIAWPAEKKNPRPRASLVKRVAGKAEGPKRRRLGVDVVRVEFSNRANERDVDPTNCIDAGTASLAGRPVSRGRIRTMRGKSSHRRFLIGCLRAGLLAWDCPL